MGRLLDEDAVKQALYDAVDDISSGYYEVDGIREGDIERIINSVPSAQPGIIYCNECKHRASCVRSMQFYRLNGISTIGIKFCSRGE